MDDLKALFELIMAHQWWWPTFFYLGGLGIAFFHSDLLFFLLGVRHSSLLLLMICGICLSLGEVTLSFMARKLGPKIYRHGPLSLVLKPKHLLRARRIIARYGLFALLAIRFLPGTRSAVFLSMGMLRYPMYKIFLMNLLSLAVWAPILYLAGKMLWIDRNQLESLLSSALLLALFLIAIVLILYYLSKHFKKPRQ